MPVAQALCEMTTANKFLAVIYPLDGGTDRIRRLCLVLPKMRLQKKQTRQISLIADAPKSTVEKIN